MVKRNIFANAKAKSTALNKTVVQLAFLPSLTLNHYTPVYTKDDLKIGQEWGIKEIPMYKGWQINNYLFMLSCFQEFQT